MAKTKLKDHERIALERWIRKYIKRSRGFRKGLTNADKMTANALLRKAGRPNDPRWDESIDLNMINTKSIVRPKKSHNSID